MCVCVSVRACIDLGPPASHAEHERKTIAQGCERDTAGLRWHTEGAAQGNQTPSRPGTHHCVCVCVFVRNAERIYSTTHNNSVSAQIEGVG